MTEQSSDANLKPSVGRPQPLEFQLIADNGHAAVYEALVVDCKTSGTPVFGITVTVASSIQHDAGKQLAILLGGMKAAFAVVPGPPPPADGDPGHDEPFDISTQVGIGVRLASFGGPESTGVEFAVETATGVLPLPKPGGGKAPVILQSQVDAGLSDRWRVNYNGSLAATVTPGIGGHGTLHSAGQPTQILKPSVPSNISGIVVVVTAAKRNALSYTLTGYFHRTRHNVL